MLELVRGYAMAAFDASVREDRIEVVATGLDEISGVFLSSENLRNAITDPSIPTQARGAVLEDLLADKVPEEAVGVVTFTVEYERPGEVPKTTNILCGLVETVIENVAAGEPQPAEPPHRAGRGIRRIGATPNGSSRRSPSRRTSTSSSGSSSLAGSAEDTPQLPRRPRRRQRPLAAPGGAERPARWESPARHDDAVRLRAASRARPGLCRGTGKPRGAGCCGAGRRLADVRSAVELDGDERQRLEAALARIARRPVELRVHIDPGVIGGLSIILGNTIIDGTLRHRLEQLRESLLQPLLQRA